MLSPEIPRRKAINFFQLTGKALGPVRHFWPGLIPRNLLFLTVVLAHGFRRLTPP
jgi:hypothetical protein